LDESHIKAARPTEPRYDRERKTQTRKERKKERERERERKHKKREKGRDTFMKKQRKGGGHLKARCVPRTSRVSYCCLRAFSNEKPEKGRKSLRSLSLSLSLSLFLSLSAPPYARLSLNLDAAP